MHDDGNRPRRWWSSLLDLAIALVLSAVAVGIVVVGVILASGLD